MGVRILMCVLQGEIWEFLKQGLLFTIPFKVAMLKKLHIQNKREQKQVQSLEKQCEMHLHTISRN